MTSQCPLCGSDSIRVIYYGLPHRLCKNQQCNCNFGFCSSFTQWLLFNGFFYTYEGHYLPALWRWLFGSEE